MNVSFKDDKSISTISGIASKLKQGVQKTLTDIFGRFKQDLRNHDVDEQRILSDK